MTNKIKILIAGMAGVLLTGSIMTSCYYDNAEELYGSVAPCDTSAVTFAGSIQPILEAECLTCHSATNADGLGGGNNLEGFDNVINFVTVGDPANSSLYNSVAWLAGASFMPKSGQQLSDCDIAKIRIWITSGAANN